MGASNLLWLAGQFDVFINSAAHMSHQLPLLYARALYWTLHRRRSRHYSLLGDFNFRMLQQHWSLGLGPTITLHKVATVHYDDTSIFLAVKHVIRSAPIRGNALGNQEVYTYLRLYRVRVIFKNFLILATLS